MAWEPALAEYPHELIIELATSTTINGFSYLPRQDMDTGWISAYELYVSADGQNWGVPAAKGVFEKNSELKKIRLTEPVRARFLRFVAQEGFDAKPFAAIAETDIE